MSDHVLMVTKFIPFPANTGGKRRSLAVLERYLERNDRVTLLAHEDETSDAEELARRGVVVLSVPWTKGPRRLLGSLVRTQSGLLGRFFSRELYDKAREVAEAQPFDVLQIEYLHNVIYSDLPARVKVLDLHDIVSEQTKRIGSVQRWPMRLLYELESRRVAHYERRASSRFDVVACVSVRDAEALEHPNVHVASNGWDATPGVSDASDDTVVFTGTFSFSVNIDAALWFASEIWPKVRAARPQSRWILVGRDPAPEVRELAHLPGVTVTGTVPDVSPYLQQARVSVVPLRAGSGSRLKILESLEAGRPVVSTSIGLEGLEQLQGKGATVADEPNRFASEVIELLESPARALEEGRRGRAAIHRDFLWRETLTPMFDAIDRARSRAGTFAGSSIEQGSAELSRTGWGAPRRQN